MANAALLLDYLFLQGLIEQRLAEKLPGLPVRGVEEMGQVLDATVRVDTVFVLWDGERFPDAAEAGKSVLVRQRWMLIFAHPNAGQSDPAARNRSAGARLSELHKAIAGWLPAGAHRGFYRANGAKPNYRAGQGLYPLTFEILLTL